MLASGHRQRVQLWSQSVWWVLRREYPKTAQRTLVENLASLHVTNVARNVAVHAIRLPAAVVLTDLWNGRATGLADGGLLGGCGVRAPDKQPVQRESARS